MKPSCFSTKIDPSLKERLLSDLKEQGFQIETPAYTLFSAKKPGLCVTLYASGSLTVQGKNKEEFIEFYLEPQILKNFSYTHPLADVDTQARIGSDEAGKGDFFGSLCTVAAFADSQTIEKLIQLKLKDSKRFSDQQIFSLEEKIAPLLTYHAVILSPVKYNELYKKFRNLNTLLAWCHAAAIETVHQKTKNSVVIVDQFAQPIVLEKMIERKNLSLSLTQKVRAEEDIVVAAASVLARKCFLDSIKKLSDEIGIALPKGASAAVKETAKKILIQKGPGALERVCKTHFKTFAEVLESVC